MKWEQTFAYLHLEDLHVPRSLPKRYIEGNKVDTPLETLERLVRYTSGFDGSDSCEQFRIELLKLYQAALNHVEEVLDPFIERFRENSMIILTGDHGEAHWEHHRIDQRFTDSRPNYSVGHGGTPFDMVTRVPLAADVLDGKILPENGFALLYDIPVTVSREVLKDHPFDKREWHEEIPENRIVSCEGTRYGTERKAAYRGRKKVIRSKTDGMTLTSEINPNACEIFTGEGLDDEEILELLGALPEYWSDWNIDSKTGTV
ncbi:sulfatase-like hydrolase/transferase [Haladaptatus sp. CMAA 1911]|uniref:sulfatase-like hydrolase/transferase n=1 Tax=unclassified Haladaptatus TaxID=2622732 RepID=UPI003754D4AA